MELQVRARTAASTRCVLLELALPQGGLLPLWTPGAHIELTLEVGGQTLVRQYSLCGDCADTQLWTIAVLREHNSRGGSAFLCDQLQVGHILRCSGPRNHFAFAPKAQRVRLVAAGIGITPLLSMAHAAQQQGCDWQLIYLVRERADACLALALQALPAHRVQIYCSAERGRFDLAQWSAGLDAQDSVYACGPLRLLDDLSALQEARPSWALQLERFENPNKAMGADSSFELVLARSGQRLTVGAGETMLGVLRRHHIDVPWSCSDGVCGTCEQAVLAGTPDHRDAVLSVAERCANTHVMVCVSRSLSPSLTLDL
jgi:ferredoxin-NADP reductase